LFGRDKSPVPLDRIEVTIGPTANITGDLQCDGIVRIDGIYQGSIKTVSNVIISETARVDAQIVAENVSVSGQVKGSIVAKSRLEILSTGKVWADATVTSFLLDDGGKLHGGLKMFGTGPEPESFDVPPATNSTGPSIEAPASGESAADALDAEPDPAATPTEGE
jgi:cytoskeletal protein CcmA (bactofilin family)